MLNIHIKYNFLAWLDVYKRQVLAFNGDVQVETFSSLKKQGVDKLRQKLDTWFSEMQPCLLYTSRCV